MTQPTPEPATGPLARLRASGPDRRQPDDFDRETALIVAARLTTNRHDPGAVLPAATRILAWLADNDEPGRVQDKVAAMRQHYHDIRRYDGPGVTAHADDAHGFITAAAQYVPFLAGEAAA